MSPWLLVSLLVVMCDSLEVNVHTGPLSPNSWTAVYSFPCLKSDSVEIDIDVHAYRSGIVGTILDVFSLVIPSNFDLELRGNDNSTVLYSTSFNQSLSTLSAVVKSSPQSPVSIWIRNRNEWLSIEPWLVGEIIHSSDQFDLRSKFPSCPFPVYSQQMCGACYADVVAGAGTDDLCISNDGSPVAKKLSPQPIVSCSNLGGCAGGSPYLAAQWTSSNGLTEVSNCPFMSGTCAPQDDSGKDGCVECDAGKMFPFNALSYRFRPIALYPNSEYAIRRHIETQGSVMVIFIAHTNFQEFFSSRPFGIYSNSDGTPSLGNHAVRLVGFGVDGGTRYWIAINSWGNDWANRGSFKIVRGENFCSIEQYPVGISYMGPGVSAGVAVPSGDSASSNENYPVLGEWMSQNVSDSYWTRFVEANKIVLSRELNCPDGSFKVETIQTKMGHGFNVRLGTDYGRVHLHVSPRGLVEIQSKREKLSPEKAHAVLIH